MTIDRQTFFAGVRSLFGGRMSQAQIDGTSAILDEWDKRQPNADLRWLAYMLATTFHETAQKMQPVREAFWKSEEWRRRNLSRYYPYYGRGYVQLTWDYNYRKAGAYVGDNLISQPDLALRLDYAAAIMFVGMEEGWFRGDRQGRRHTLSRYFNHTTNDPVGARAIINGEEWKDVNGRRVLLARIIARYHETFLDALSGGTRQASATVDRFASNDLARMISGATYTAFADEPASDETDTVFAPGTEGSERRDEQILNLTAQIVTGYVGNNQIPGEALPDLILKIRRALEADPSEPSPGEDDALEAEGDSVGDSLPLDERGPEEPGEAVVAPPPKASARHRNGKRPEPGADAANEG